MTCNITDRDTWQDCAADLGNAAGQFVQKNACGKICGADGRVIFARECPQGAQGIVIGPCGQQPTTPAKNTKKDKNSSVLDTYVENLFAGDVLTVLGTLAAGFVLYKVVS